MTTPTDTHPGNAKPLSGAEIVLKALVDQVSRSSSAIRAVPFCRSTTRCFSRTVCVMCWCAMNRPPFTTAEGYARSTGKVGVVLVTSGPGATNAVTGLLDAFDGFHSAGLPDRSGAHASHR